MRRILILAFAPLLAAQSINTGNHRALFTPVACTTCVLDSVSVTPVVAYALRKLRTAYAGKAVNVVRASDSTNSDIGFNANGTLDTSTLSTFCSGTTCTVATWYDQSGNGTNAVQPTAAYQPVLVSSGTIQTINTLPAINGNLTGSSPSQLCIAGCSTNVTLYQNFVNTVEKVTTITNGGNFFPNFVRQQPNSTGAEWALRLDDSSTTKYNFYRVAIGAVTPATAVDTSPHVLSADDSAAIYLDGTSIGTASLFTNTSTVGHAALLSCADFTPSGNTCSLKGLMAEFMDFSTRLGTTDRNTLTNNQKTYFSIP